VSRRFLLLVNPSAGGGRALDRLPAAEAEFGRLGAEFRTARTRDIQHAAEEARTAVERGETVAAMGGDGLLRPLAGILHHTSAALAIIPGGRGNDLARVLEIPEDPAEAVRIAVNGDERMLDVGYVDDTPFLGIASFGFDSDANKIANEARLVRGNLVYVYAALRALISWRPATFTATIDGERHEITGYSMGVANSKAYGGGMYVAPQAVLDDGKLDIVAKERVPKLRFLFALPKYFKGTHVSDPTFHAWTGADIEVGASRTFEIYADGDPIGATPARITVRPRCLRVIAPPA
jgi:YegS/Rv2252/BmrU family lipid kinase